MSEYPKWLRAAASKGGKATGAAKVRGDAAYYKRISKKAAKARKAKSPNDEASNGTRQKP
jgi:hypothetical protein